MPLILFLYFECNNTLTYILTKVNLFLWGEQMLPPVLKMDWSGGLPYLLIRFAFSCVLKKNYSAVLAFGTLQRSMPWVAALLPNPLIQPCVWGLAVKCSSHGIKLSSLDKILFSNAFSFLYVIDSNCSSWKCSDNTSPVQQALSSY